MKLNRLLINGGVLSPGELKYICEAAEDLGLFGEPKSNTLYYIEETV